MQRARQRRLAWHIAIEVICYLSAIALPPLLEPVIASAVFTPGWRIGTLAAIGLALAATGVLVRLHWPLSWVPSCALATILGVVISPWHVLTFVVSGVGLASFFATQFWPSIGDPPNPARGARGATISLALLCAGACVIGVMLLRLSALAGFPLSLSHAMSARGPQVPLMYLRDNPGAMQESNPDGLPWVLYASKHADPRVMEAMLSSGLPIHGYDWRELGSPMEWLAENSPSGADGVLFAKFRLLARYGCPPSGAAIAAKRGHSALAKALVEMGDSVNRPDKTGQSPLSRLIAANDVSAVSILLDSGVRLLPARGDLSEIPPVSIPSEAMGEVLYQHGQLTTSRLTPESLAHFRGEALPKL